MTKTATKHEAVEIANNAISKYQELFHSAGIHIQQFDTQNPTIRDIEQKIEQVEEVQDQTHRPSDERKLNRVIKDLSYVKYQIDS